MIEAIERDDRVGNQAVSCRMRLGGIFLRALAVSSSMRN